MDVYERASASKKHLPRAKNLATADALARRLRNLRQTLKYLRADDAFHCQMQIIRIEQRIAETTKNAPP